MTGSSSVVWQVFDGLDCVAVFIDRADAVAFRDHHIDQIECELGSTDDVRPADLVVVRACHFDRAPATT